MSAQQAVNEEIDVLLKTLQQAEEPLTVNQIRKRLPAGKFKLSEERIAEIIDDQLRQQRIYRFEPYRSKQDRYWTRGHEEYARESILRALDKQPMSRKELINQRMKALLRGYSGEKKQDLVIRLLKENAIRELPPLLGSRTKLLSAHPPNSQFYIEEALTKLMAILGISQEQLIEDTQKLLTRLRSKDQMDVEAPPPSVSQPAAGDLTRLIFDRMAQIEPAAMNGALVSLTKLRSALKNEIADKEAFDQAIIQLSDQGRAALHKHDYPASLSQNELDDLVTDGSGRYYIGIALRA